MKQRPVIKWLAFSAFLLWALNLIACLTIIAPRQSGELGKREGTHYYLYTGRGGYVEVPRSVYMRVGHVTISGLILTPLGLIGGSYFYRATEEDARQVR